jgi:hypothetical protein
LTSPQQDCIARSQAIRQALGRKRVRVQQRVESRTVTLVGTIHRNS